MSCAHIQESNILKENFFLAKCNHMFTLKPNGKEHIVFFVMTPSLLCSFSCWYGRLMLMTQVGMANIVCNLWDEDANVKHHSRLSFGRTWEVLYM